MSFRLVSKSVTLNDRVSADGQGTKCHRNIAENYNRLSRVHERYRRQTDRRQTGGRQHIANVNGTLVHFR